MVDEMLPLEGFRELWGSGIFQCPYCHGWEIREQRWAYLVTAEERLPFAMLMRGWTADVIVLTGGNIVVPPERQQQFEAAGIRIETRPIARLVAQGAKLEGVELQDGSLIACDALFAHPAQRQVELVRSLGLELDGEGFVRADPMTRETSIPGIYAAGDLTWRMQGAMFAAAAGTQAATTLNHELTTELAIARAI
jgi:thioredoxin reductase